MNTIGPVIPAGHDPQRITAPITPDDTDFATHLREAEGKPGGNQILKAMEEVQALQDQADQAIVKLATGETQDIHQVIVAFEQARLSMQLLVETRNKLVESYQEISRMPV